MIVNRANLVHKGTIHTRGHDMVLTDIDQYANQYEDIQRVTSPLGTPKGCG